MKRTPEAGHVTEMQLGGRGRRSSQLRVTEPLELEGEFEFKRGSPASRADCPKTRPCPYIECRYHLWLVESESRPGRRHLRDKGGAPRAELNPATPTTCALDVADKGQHTFAEIGALFGVTDERARNIFERAIEKVNALGYTMDELFPQQR